MKRTPRRDIPSTESLVIFDAAARHGGFTRAGVELGLTQSAVSRQILDLESFLGAALFDRSRRALALTDTGHDYWAAVRPLLDGLETATVEARLRRVLHGAIHLSVAASFCNRWLIPKLPGFIANHPGTLINVSSRVGPIDLDASRFEAAIVNASAPPAGVHAQRLLNLRLAAYASPKLLKKAPPLAATDIAGLPLLHLQEEPRAWAAYFSALGCARVAVPDGAHHSLLLLTCEAALAGLGAALLPPEFVADDVAAGRLMRLAPTEISGTRAYHLIWRPVDHANPALRAFRAWMAAELSAGGDAG